jgi:hypothetical protein
MGIFKIANQFKHQVLKKELDNNFKEICSPILITSGYAPLSRNPGVDFNY